MFCRCFVAFCTADTKNISPWTCQSQVSRALWAHEKLRLASGSTKAPEKAECRVEMCYYVLLF